MALLLTVVALIAATVLAGLAYAARLVYVYVGPDILHIGWRLLRQGSLRFSKLVLRPALSVRGFALVEPKAAEGEQLFSAELCTVQSPLKALLSGQNIELAISNAIVNLHQDSQGNFRWINLLETVDAVTPVPAAEAPPEMQPKGRLKRLRSGKQAAEVTYKQVPFTADISAYILRAYLRDSRLDLPEPAALILGDNLHAKFVLGMPNVAQHADATEGYDSAWCANTGNWPSSTPTTGAVLYPVLLEAQSPNCQLALQGWRTSTGLLLHQPISMSLAFTPAFAKYALRQLTPLLGSAVGLQGGSSLQVTVEPVKGHVPAEQYTVRVQPMRLVMASTGFLSGILGLLKLKQLQSANFEAWTSPVEADIVEGSQVVSKRVDILLGSSLGTCKGVHLIMWGQVDLLTNALDMTLGVPATALKAAGVQDLPPDYVLPVPVKGTSQAPVVEWSRAVAQLTELTIKKRVSRDLPWLGTLVGAFGGPKLDMSNYPTAPTLVGELPWQAQDVSTSEVVIGAERTASQS